MGWRGTTALVGLLAGLGFALWWADRDGPVDHTDPTLTLSALDGRSLDSAIRIVIQTGPDTIPIELGRESGGGWRIEEPIVDFASRGRLEAIRVTFDSAELIAAYQHDEIDQRLLEETGIAAPRTVLRVEWPDGHEVRLEIGLEGPYGDDVFVRRGDVIYRGDLGLYTVLRTNPEELRDRFVFRNQLIDARTVRLTRRTTSGGSEVFEVTRRGAEAWRMTRPFTSRVDQTAAHALAASLLGLQIGLALPGATPDDRIGPPGPDDEPYAVIEVEGAAGGERLVLSRIQEALFGFIEGRNLRFEADPTLIARYLETPVEAFRARNLIEASFDDAPLVRITTPGADPLELQRSPRGLDLIRRPISTRANSTAVAELRQAVRSLGVLEFVADDAAQLADYGLDEGFTILELGGSGGRSTEILQLGAAASTEAVYARRADERGVVTVPAAAVAVVRRPWTVYVDLEIMKLTASADVRTIRATSNTAEIEIDRGDDGQFRRPGEDQVDPAIVEAFDTLRDLRGVAAVHADRLDTMTRLGDIELLGVGGRSLFALQLYRDDAGATFCRRADEPTLGYELSAAVVGRLAVLLP